ncbi:hypothetical protein AB205_0068920, partial [Aquarana catesbeiana]
CVLDQRRGKIAGRLSFLFSSGVHWTVYEGRLEATFLFSFIQVSVGPLVKGGWRPVCVGPAVSGGWRPVCIGLTMREDWTPCVFSLFCRCLLDQRRGKIAGRLSFLFSSGVCCTGCRGGWKPVVFSLFFRWVLDRLLGKIGGCLSFLFSSGVCWTGYEGRLQAACLVSYL